MAAKINNRSMSPLLTDALASFNVDASPHIAESALTVIADHLRSALEGASEASLESVERELKIFFQELLAKAPDAARQVIRGIGSPAEAASYYLGQAAFAHLLAARTLDTRADDVFTQMLEDKRYHQYLRALLDGAKDGVSLARMVEETPETVSRKLAILRGRGLVVARQEGTRIVNRLSPAAKAMLQHRGVEPLREQAVVSEDVAEAVEELKEEAPEFMRARPVFRPKKAA